jgi:hypothetical protein
VGVNSAAKLISLNTILSMVIVTSLQYATSSLTVEVNESLMLATLLWTETAATKDKNHYPHYRFAADQ